jgi:hypothetical protein
VWWLYCPEFQSSEPVIVSDFSDWWQTVLVLFCSDQLGLATIVSACLDIWFGLAVISGITVGNDRMMFSFLKIYIFCKDFIWRCNNFIYHETYLMEELSNECVVLLLCNGSFQIQLTVWKLQKYPNWYLELSSYNNEDKRCFILKCSGVPASTKFSAVNVFYINITDI